MFHNKGYAKMDESTKVYIKIDKIDFGGYKHDNKSAYMACVGSRNTYKDHGEKFTAKEQHPNHVWTYTVDHVQRASFVFALYKCHFLTSHKEIGHIELKLKGLKPNTITTQEFTLPTDTEGCSPKITFSIHITDNGEKPFTQSLLNNNVENAFFE